MSIFTREECDRRIAEVKNLVTMNSDIQVLKTFDNQFQVDAYAAFKKEQNRHYLVERITKVILKLGGLISAVSGAIAVVLEVLI